MTVAELIEELESFPSNETVVVRIAKPTYKYSEEWESHDFAPTPDRYGDKGPVILNA